MLKINTFYSYLLLLLAITSLAGGVGVIYKLEPSNINNVIAFYSTTGLFVFSATAYFLYFFRQRFGVRELAQTHFIVSLRQGIWLAIFYVLSLILQYFELFTWLNTVFLMIALTCLESYFIYRERKSRLN